jgi:hypothetical protein
MRQTRSLDVQGSHHSRSFSAKVNTVGATVSPGIFSADTDAPLRLRPSPPGA